MDGFLKREREAVDSLQKAKKLREHWESMIKDAHKDANKIRRDAIGPRKITFASPSDQQPLTTPKENMQKAAEILTKKNEEIDIDHLRTLVALAMQQQSKADTSRKLESNPELCMSTAQKDASGSKHRDDESRTGSTERRRRTREHPNPIPVPSKTPPSDPKKGKDAMYTGRDKYRNPSPPPNGHPRPPPPRRRSPVGNTRPHGPGGINIRDNVVPQSNGNTERTPEPRRSRNEEREPEPRRSRNVEATVTMVKAATEAGVSSARDAENLTAEARDRIGALADPPPHHLAVEAEVGAKAEAADPAHAQNPTTMARATRGNVSTNTDVTTLAQSPARIRLHDLEKNSIFCWFDPKNAFEKHFRGTYKRPATTSDLQACIQKKGETSRNFLTRWLQTRNECENVDNRTAMLAFIGGLQRGSLLRHKLTCLVSKNKLILDDMINIASKHTAAGDDAGGDLAATAIPLHQQKKNRDNGGSSSNNRKYPPDDQKSGGSDMVAIAFQRGGQGGGRGRGSGGGAGRGQQRADEVTVAGTRAPQTYEEYRDMPCLAHIDPTTGKSSHTNRKCKWVNDLKTDPEAGYKRARNHRPRGKGGKGKNKDKEEDSSEALDEDDASPNPKEESVLVEFLRANMDIFAWQPSDMSGVPRELAEHYLNINLGAKTVKQAMRRFGDKKSRAIGMELAKLLEAGATYQRTMQRCLKDQIGRNVHAYMDDIAVMTRKGSDLISDLTETFDNLRRYKMMLNPLKCVYGVPVGKLLGFIVSHRGIEVNPEKIKAILCIKRPTCLKHVQY
ncbi:hypothetical protein QYE76_031271 [Lolium multiflorum]|uniref:Reverse transcriptase domain-containing protein n=1 Tax=Lolium multiflorum TaxID=4521 RepID=A0AAD8QRC4_LOLMU|nr:hypothetical protein QYE76_031271 [Lolium multiflorum]